MCPGTSRQLTILTANRAPFSVRMFPSAAVLANSVAFTGLVTGVAVWAIWGGDMFPSETDPKGDPETWTESEMQTWLRLVCWLLSVTSTLVTDVFAAKSASPPPRHTGAASRAHTGKHENSTTVRQLSVSWFAAAKRKLSSLGKAGRREDDKMWATQESNLGFFGTEEQRSVETGAPQRSVLTTILVALVIFSGCGSVVMECCRVLNAHRNLAFILQPPSPLSRCRWTPL